MNAHTLRLFSDGSSSWYLLACFGMLYIDVIHIIYRFIMLSNESLRESCCIKVMTLVLFICGSTKCSCGLAKGMKYLRYASYFFGILKWIKKMLTSVEVWKGIEMA